MKINELLNESDNEQLDEILGTLLGLGARGIGKLGGALLKGSKTGKQAVQAVTHRVAPTMAASTGKADRILRGAGIDTSTWLNSKWRDVLAWQIQRKGMKAFKLSQAAAYENGKIAANLVGDLGLSGFGLATLAYDLTSYYHTRQVLEEKYANDPDKLNDELASLNVSTVASIFLPRVVGSLGKMSSGVVGAIIGKVAGPRAGAITKFWGGTIAKVGEASAMAIFRSDAGKKWLADSLAFISAGIGSASKIISALGDLFKAAGGVIGDLFNTLLGNPNLISIGVAGKWLPSGMDDALPWQKDKEKAKEEPAPAKKD